FLDQANRFGIRLRRAALKLRTLTVRTHRHLRLGRHAVGPSLSLRSVAYRAHQGGHNQSEPSAKDPVRRLSHLRLLYGLSREGSRSLTADSAGINDRRAGSERLRAGTS